MFAKSKIVRFTLGACLTAACLSLGDGLLQPAQANAVEIVRTGPIVREGVMVGRPIVAVDPDVQGGPVVTAGPIVRTGPVYAHPGYWHYGFHYGFHWHC